MKIDQAVNFAKPVAGLYAACTSMNVCVDNMRTMYCRKDTRTARRVALTVLEGFAGLTLGLAAIQDFRSRATHVK